MTTVERESLQDILQMLKMYEEELRDATNELERYFNTTNIERVKELKTRISELNQRRREIQRVAW